MNDFAVTGTRDQIRFYYLRTIWVQNKMKREKFNKICSDFGILTAYLFGSIAEQGKELLDAKNPAQIDPLADIDMGIVFLKKPSNPKEKIKIYGKLFSKLSEIFSPFPLDLILLQETGVIIQFEAINGVSVYSHDEDRRLDYEEKVIKLYQDWKPDYDQYTREVLEGITK
tara:strand:- start:6932 stop:7441 length:510 start_codon:yes stop_codon:yes gene_type:complete